MSAIENRGTLVPQEQEFEREYDPSSGYTETRRWETFSEAQALALANSCAQHRMAHKLSVSHGMSLLTAVDTSRSVTMDNWQILANEARKNIWEHPDILRLLRYGAGTDFYTDSVASIQAALDNRIGWSKLADFLDESARFDQFMEAAGGDLTTLKNCYAMAMRGQDEYPLSQYVLKHTTSTPNVYRRNIADLNVDKIYTTAQLLNEAQDDDLWVNPLPNELAYVISHLEAPEPQAGYLWGWLKRSPTRTIAANNRVEISTEYWLEQWETTLLQIAQ